MRGSRATNEVQECCNPGEAFCIQYMAPISLSQADLHTPITVCVHTPCVCTTHSSCLYIQPRLAISHHAKKAQHGTPICVQNSAEQHSTAQHSAAQRSTAPHSTTQHCTAQNNTAQQRLCSIAWHMWYRAMGRKLTNA